MRLRHLVLGWQVDPELYHFKLATAARKIATVELFVDYTRGRCHPLHVAGTDLATATRRIPMFDFAVVDYGYGFETTVRMLAHTEPFFGRREFGWASVIEQQERAE